MPLVWIALGIGALAIWWKAASHFPPANADVLTLLNFPPYSLQTGKNYSLLVLAPEALNKVQMSDELRVSVNVLTISRMHIPIPGPTTVLQFANLWTVQSALWDNSSITVTPSTLLQQQRGGGPPLASNIDAARQLAAVLYASAFAGKSDVFPINAKAI